MTHFSKIKNNTKRRTALVLMLLFVVPLWLPLLILWEGLKEVLGDLRHLPRDVADIWKAPQ